MAGKDSDAAILAKLEAKLAPYRKGLPSVEELRRRLGSVGAAPLRQRMRQLQGASETADVIDTEGEET